MGNVWTVHIVYNIIFEQCLRVSGIILLEDKSIFSESWDPEAFKNFSVQVFVKMLYIIPIEV